MNIEFKNDLENNQMIMKITWSRRKKINEKRIIMKTHEILDYANNNYTAPKGYALKECVDGLRTADNDSMHRESINCVFRLEEIKKPTVQKKSVTKKSASDKKTSQRKK